MSPLPGVNCVFLLLLLTCRLQDSAGQYQQQLGTNGQPQQNSYNPFNPSLNGFGNNNFPQSNLFQSNPFFQNLFNPYGNSNNNQQGYPQQTEPQSQNPQQAQPQPQNPQQAQSQPQSLTPGSNNWPFYSNPWNNFFNPANNYPTNPYTPNPSQPSQPNTQPSPTNPQTQQPTQHNQQNHQVPNSGPSPNAGGQQVVQPPVNTQPNAGNPQPDHSSYPVVPHDQSKPQPQQSNFHEDPRTPPVGAEDVAGIEQFEDDETVLEKELSPSPQKPQNIDARYDAQKFKGNGKPNKRPFLSKNVNEDIEDVLLLQ